MKDIEIIDIDYSAVDPLFKKEDEVEIAKISGPWIVPEEGPIYKDSVRIIGNSGLDLIPGTDFECVEPVTDLTQVTGKSVHLYVELKDHILSSGGKVKLIYQKVGKPVISVKTLLQMLEDMVISGKSIDWETQVTGKPKTYYPAWHSHDIQNDKELVGFGGLVELFSRLTWEHKESGAKMKELIEELQTKVYDRLNYIQRLKWGAIMTHVRNYRNPHGVVPANVDAGNIANNATATPQQDLEGTRQDLYSTPKGFKQAIEGAEPVSEEYISQNELPFGYYGSGIYLPPPITGSFEGLGCDVENSVFCLEGNGWLVGLIRAFDGRVKNLYYSYNTDFTDRNDVRSPWLNTYVQYRHPISGSKPINFAISGSNDSVLMVGSQAIGANGIDDPSAWWIGASNSTFDPNSHTLKPTNMADMLSTLPTGNCVPGHMTVTHVGEWVYLLMSIDTFAGDTMGPGDDYKGSVGNYQTRMFRVPFKDLLDPARTIINFAPVNVTFDNADRDHRVNQPALFTYKIQRTGTDPYEVKHTVVNFSRPVASSWMNRKLQFFILPNPNNPKLARVKLLHMPFQTIVDSGTGGTRSFQVNVMMDYEWDVVSNTWTLGPYWRKPTWNSDTGEVINPDQNFTDNISADYYSWHAARFSNVSISWIPGFGFVSMGSQQAGPPPYLFALSKFNRTGDPRQDYDSFMQPINWKDAAGQQNTWAVRFRQRSPFGVAGFPRHYSQLYALKDGNRQYPIEIFIAENENQGQQAFYRITEGGADDGYIYRQSLQSPYISDRQIRGRKTNSSFGLVDGINYGVGYVNRPKRRDAKSRGTGLVAWQRTKVNTNPGAPYEFTVRTDADGRVWSPGMEDDGSVIVNLDLDYSLDTVARKLYCRATPTKQVKLPQSFWRDMVLQAIGTHANELIDISASFFINPEPGNNGDQAYSMWQVTYHVKSSPGNTRMVIGVFTWEVASTDPRGVRVLRPVGMSYPFTANATGLPQNLLRPGSADNTVAVNHHATQSDGSWNYISYGTGLSVKGLNMQILDIDAEGPRNKEQVYQPGCQIATPGNASQPRIVYRVRNGAVAEATVLWVGAQAFNQEYHNVVFANQDHGWMRGQAPQTSGAAMDLLYPWTGTYNDQPTAGDFYVMNGATYVEGNWSVFINADVLVTFNGYSMIAKMTNWDLRDLTDVYRNQTFYIYCMANGSVAEYEITKILRHHNSNGILVATIKTDDFGIVSITPRQNFTISGFPLTRIRDMGIPVSSGALTEQGTYRFLKRTELYQN